VARKVQAGAEFHSSGNSPDRAAAAAVPPAEPVEPDGVREQEPSGSGLSAQEPEGLRVQVPRWFWRFFDGAVEVILAIALLVPAVSVLANIFTREVLGFSLLWVQELSICGLYVLAFVGGAAAYPRGNHVAVTLLTDRLPPRWKRVQGPSVHWLVFALAMTLLWNGLPLVAGDWRDRTTVMQISLGLYQLPLELGLGVLAVYCLRSLSRLPWRDTVASGAGVIGVWAVVYFTRSDWLPLSLGVALTLTLVLMAGLLAAGTPVGFVLGLGAVVYLFAAQTGPPTATPLEMLNGVNSFVLLAIPFFVFAGFIMDRGGVSARLVRFVSALVGRVPGGLLQVMIVSMYLFSGISGSKGADIAAVGSVMSRDLKRAGYPAEEGVAVLTASAAMGETVPPSIAMIVLGSITTLSVGSLFLAGLLPAAAIGVGLMLLVFIRAKRGRLGAHVAKYSASQVGGSESESAVGIVFRSAPAVLMPLILIGGILFGIATPTEVASVAILYGILLSIAYRKLTLRAFAETVRVTTAIVGMVLFIIATATAFTYAVTVANVPQDIAQWMLSLPGGRVTFLLITILVLIIMGSILEGLPALLVFGPLLVPVATQLGINPLAYGIVVIIAMGIGAFTPPLGVGLYIACSVCETDLAPTIRPVLRYEVVLIIGLLVVAFIPEIALFLPRLFGVGG
jgi:tripartite ATP-independent transporter DctM subunit